MASAEPDLLLVGLDHRSAPVELREQVSLAEEQAADALVHLLAREEIHEALVVSTCNRTEVYVDPRAPGAEEVVVDQVFRARAPEAAEPGRLFVRNGPEAARHLLRVASGLESMVLGEPEILGQVRQAGALAERVGAAGPVLGKLSRAALAAGKRARAETAIGEGAVSLGYATLELTRNIFDRLEGRRAFLLGAGEIARSAAKALTERAGLQITVTNRGEERLKEFLADFPQARPVPFEARGSGTAEADVVIAATGAGEAILTATDLRSAMRRRPDRPLLVVDLGVPRNVEPGARRVENLFLHDLDSLDGLIQKNLRRRREEVPKVEEIVAGELERFLRWWRGLEAEPLVARLQKQAEAIRQRELAAVLERFPAELHEEVEHLTRSLVRKILHHPSTRLRAQDEERTLPQLELVRELFQLGDEEE
ncbi:MAG TPA: glutamyl-tRNA reductase [Thermoanaerobaculia bacterium]|nr:glutamyl-tRNA reductase [Thermoanaerobaculia bacterium]